MKDILEEYPHLTREQILAVLAYAYDQIHNQHMQEAS